MPPVLSNHLTLPDSFYLQLSDLTSNFVYTIHLLFGWSQIKNSNAQLILKNSYKKTMFEVCWIGGFYFIELFWCKIRKYCLMNNENIVTFFYTVSTNIVKNKFTNLIQNILLKDVLNLQKLINIHRYLGHQL